MSLLSWFLGAGGSIKPALKNGAVIIDIRTVHEYDQGRLRGSVNIPEDRLPSSVDRIRDFKKPVIICSSSYSRNARAVNFLKKQGVKDIYNGGSWEKVLQQINSL